MPSRPAATEGSAALTPSGETRAGLPASAGLSGALAAAAVDLIVVCFGLGRGAKPAPGASASKVIMVRVFNQFVLEHDRRMMRQVSTPRGSGGPSRERALRYRGGY